MTKKITRREALKLLAGTVAAAALSPVLPGYAFPTFPSDSDEDKDDTDWVLMGRAIHPLSFYERPTTSSERIATLARDEGVRILSEVRAPFSAHNDLWYRTELGYVHSAWLLPMRIYPLQPFIRDIGSWGFWGEVSQIFTEGRVAPSAQAGRKYRFYGGNVFHVVEAVEDEEGNGWYKVVDDYPPKTISYQWVVAQDMRRIPRSEMAPIHPFVGNKRIEVDLSQQKLTCYEGDKIVFTTLVAAGVGGDLATPTGQKCVLLKQPSRHMSNVPYAGAPEPTAVPEEIFDLPGIPWNIFFDLEGTAIHGVYWHNDFGVRRSHGCLNVSSEAARWIYRWVHPIGGFEDEFVQSTYQVGTPINIF